MRCSRAFTRSVKPIWRCRARKSGVVPMRDSQMTYISPEQFANAQKANVDAMYRFAFEAFNSFEKLVTLNMQTMKASLDVNAARWQSALSGKGAQAFFEAPEGVPPLVERIAAYHRQVFDILMNTQAALTEQAGAQYERQSRKMQ